MLRRKKQLAAKVESVEGTAVSLSANDAKLLVIDPQYSTDFNLNSRNVVRGSLSKISKITGKKSGSVKFQLEVRGSGTASVAPEWSKLLRACGFKESLLKKLTIGEITGGPFVHGETITQITSGATGRVVIKTLTGTTTLYFIDLGTGTWSNTNGITGGTSGATAVPSAVADAGIEWIPVSDELSQVSIGAITNGPFSAGMLITGATSGAKGYVYENTANGAAVLKYRVISGSFVSGEVITGTGATPPTCTSSSAATQAESPTVTIGVYNDGFLEKIKGARGKVKFTHKSGEPSLMDFEFSGVYVDADDCAMLTGVQHESSLPPAFFNAQMKVNDFDVIVSSVTIDVNNTVSARESVNDANGILSYRITERDMTGTIDPEMVLKAQQDFYAHIKNNAELVLDYTVGSTSGNKFRFYVPRLQFNNIADSDRNGIRIADLSFDLLGSLNPGDDELTIIQL